MHVIDKWNDLVYPFFHRKTALIKEGCYSMAATMKEIAAFVSSKLAVIDEVQSTATHIVLVRYKDHGTSFIEPHKDMRMVVTP